MHLLFDEILGRSFVEDVRDVMGNCVVADEFSQVELRCARGRNVHRFIAGDSALEAKSLDGLRASNCVKNDSLVGAGRSAGRSSENLAQNVIGSNPVSRK